MSEAGKDVALQEMSTYQCVRRVLISLRKRLPPQIKTETDF